MKKVGDTFDVEINWAPRPATVLAVRGKKLLVEYTMPGGTSALRILPNFDKGLADIGRPVAYHDVTVLWLQEVVKAGSRWVGKPQQGKPVPSPRELLATRQRECPTCGRKGYRGGS